MAKVTENTPKRITHDFKCQVCSNVFYSSKACKSRTPKFCSKVCYAESLKKYKICESCGVNFANYKNEKYCSRQCSLSGFAKIERSSSWNKNISIARLASEKCKGDKLYNWKGGKETERIRMKESFYKRKKRLTLPMPVDSLKKIFKIQNGNCFFCDKTLADYKAIEHLTPVSKGGDNHPFNLVYSCKSCNSTKRQQTLEEFAIKNMRLDWVHKWERIYIESL
jgi:hypothetical protein